MDKDDRLGRSLRALGTAAFSRLDGYDIRVDGVEAHYALGEELRDLEEGPYTVLRAPLDQEVREFVFDVRPRGAPRYGGGGVDGGALVQTGEADFDRAYAVEAVPAALATVVLDGAARAALLALRPCYARCRRGSLELVKRGACTEPDVVRDIVYTFAGLRAALRRAPTEMMRGAAGYRGPDAQALAIGTTRGRGELAAANAESRRRRGIRIAKLGGLLVLVGVAAALLERCP